MSKELAESVSTTNRNETTDRSENAVLKQFPSVHNEKQAVDDRIPGRGVAGTTSHYEEFLRDSYRQIEESSKENLRIRLGDSIVFTGTWAGAADVRELEEDELLEGEISATIFTVGCYRIRIADCLYMNDGSGEMHYIKRIPAEWNHRIRSRNEEGNIKGAAIARFHAMRDAMLMKGKICMVTELSAQHDSGSGVSADCWQNICRTMNSPAGKEHINYICTVKETDMVPDEHATLFVLNSVAEDFCSAENWYKFTPDEKVKKYRIEEGKQDDIASWEL